MKKSLKKIALIIISLSTLSCSNNEINRYNISGKVVDYNTGNGAANVNLRIKTNLNGSYINVLGSIGSSSDEVEVKNITTDQNGNFSVSFKKIKNIEGVFIHNLDDENYISNSKIYLIKDFNNIIYEIYKLEFLKINVKNLTPFDSNDKIEFSAPSQYLVKRENFGVQNEFITNSSGNIEQLNQWLGTNVNSEITYKVPPYFSGNLNIYKTKNNLKTFINTTPIMIIPNQINIYNINY